MAISQTDISTGHWSAEMCSTPAHRTLHMGYELKLDSTSNIAPYLLHLLQFAKLRSYTSSGPERAVSLVSSSGHAEPSGGDGGGRWCQGNSWVVLF